MKQVLHIFAKDSRRFWPEILISLAITAAFTWTYPGQWMHSSSSYGFNAVAGGAFYVLRAMVAATFLVLVPVSWWLLITRVIHAESLVGDRQFWLTRPYDWRNLFAAKVLFLLVYVGLPLFASQSLLLLLAGFHPLSWLGGLLFNLLLVAGILIIPLFALASVTSNFARMTLTLLGTLIALLAFALLASYISRGSASTPYEDRISLPLLVCFCVAAIVVQYAARQTWLSRLLLIAFPALLVVIGLITPSDTALIRRAYPRPSGPQDQIVQISFNSDSQRLASASAEPKAKNVLLNLPLRVSGVADGYAVTPNDVMVSIEAPNGAHWISPWQAIYAQNYLAGSQDSYVAVSISRAFYDQVRSLPVTLHLTFALTQTHAGKVTRVAMPAHRFSVPEFGVCTPEMAWDRSGFTGISCLAALRRPRLTYVSVLWSNDQPSDSSGPPDPNTSVQGAGWAGNLASDPAAFGITSVWNIPLAISNNINRADQGQPWQPRYLWPGTPLTFTQYNLVRRAQADLSIPAFTLPAYNRMRGHVSVAVIPHAVGR